MFDDRGVFLSRPAFERIYRLASLPQRPGRYDRIVVRARARLVLEQWTRYSTPHPTRTEDYELVILDLKEASFTSGPCYR